MATRDIIVIGASAGGFEALKKLVRGLPGDLQASIFIVWHMSPFVKGFLPDVLNRENTLQAAHAIDRERIQKRRIYVAPPDHHLLVEPNHVRITKGPKENRFRPAVDPLFRSAAYSYNWRVIGVVLSGSLDDGTAGLWNIKHHGGLAVVQDPNDAEVRSMPENAMREVEVDYSVPVSEMGDLLARLVNETAAAAEEVPEVFIEENKLTQVEIRIAAEGNAFEAGIMNFGELTPYTCPECQGVLTRLKDGKRARFRCHTGHAFSADSLLANVTGHIEERLWSVIRGIEESIRLLNHLGNHYTETNQPAMAALYFKKGHEAEARAKLVREALLSHEQLSKDIMREQAETWPEPEHPEKGVSAND